MALTSSHITRACVLQVNRLGLGIQVDYFNNTRKQFDKLLGPSKAKDYISKRSIFSITIGANDFLNNYLLPVLSIGARISESPDAFIDDMINHLRHQLKVLKHLYFTRTFESVLTSKFVTVNGGRDYTSLVHGSLCSGTSVRSVAYPIRKPSIN